LTKKDSDRRSGQRRQTAAKSDEAPLSRGKRVMFFVAAVLLFLLCAEGLFAIALRITEGQWPYSRPKSANYLLFEPHPDWVITPRKDVTVTVLGKVHHHNADGFRGTDFSPVKTKPRVACIGGSTTYCVGVADNETWPYDLGQLLKPDYEVLNFGIPGHSSVEHKKLLPQVLARYSPDAVIFQMGLNDLRNMNVADLGPDYGHFHQPSLLFSASGFCRRDRLPSVALLQGTVVLLEKLNILSTTPFPKGGPAGQVSDSVDPRVVEIFRANLDILLRECREKHVRVVLLPHTMSPETVDETNYKWWAPFLTRKGIFNALDALNAVMRSKADGEQVIYGGFMEGVTWGPPEFWDPTHLNADGNLRLARLLKDRLPWSQFSDKDETTPK
jgi:lysophospholipase L1-like esterase